MSTEKVNKTTQEADAILPGMYAALVEKDVKHSKKANNYCIVFVELLYLHSNKTLVL